jgi:hypothetical protein
VHRVCEIEKRPLPAGDARSGGGARLWGGVNFAARTTLRLANFNIDYKKH